ncbi:MAG TPA: helix-turn-helix transcriptional regulator [Pseudonocardiaceae bacterium]|jgi:transcriptional regulator with XRE-family HTH domain|nr:helix-turn-helix transcriptional regulator [Pseudonocardiaceae bacterium]
MLTSGTLLKRVRQAAGLSQRELARRAGTSRTTLSAYEHGAKSPTFATAERLLFAAGYEFAVLPHLQFADQVTSRGRVVAVPTALPRLALRDALATVALPLHLNWSAPGRLYRLADRSDRARVYEIVLREGTSRDIVKYIDGALLVDLWDELVLPRDVRDAWAPLIEQTSAEVA